MDINFGKFDRNKLPRSRIELHLHLEGSFRAATIWELAQQKGISLGVNSLDELQNALQVKTPGTLATFLKRFGIFMPVYKNDPEALERSAFELCEDQAKQGCLYFEVRFAPHPCSNTHGLPASDNVSLEDPKAVTPKMIVESVNRGLRKGEEMFNIKARAILCCLIPFPEWNEDVLSLCHEFRDNGVVGIDIAGDEGHDTTPPDIKEKYVFAVFKKAAALGIHRTVHAAEAGTAENVALAIKEMETERVGHGYRVLQDMDIYQEVLDRNIHLECCPHSSILTGAVPITTKKHPIVTFAEDGASFSISRDDPLITGTTLDCEYRMLRKMGLHEAHFIRANICAAKASFLPEEEKKLLLQELYKEYGIELH